MGKITAYPLNDSQRGVYMECIEQPESTFYNIAFALPLPSAIDADRFEAAFCKAVMLHPALFMTFVLQDGEPVMVQGKKECQVKRSVAQTLQEAKDRFARPFDLEHGPLFRFEMCTTPEGNIFLMDVHHLVFDGNSLRLLLNQTADAYVGKPLEEEKVSLFDFNAREPELKKSEAYRAAQEYFKQRLDGVEWDTDIAPDARTPQEGEGIFVADAPKSLSLEAVEPFVKENGVTAGTLFMTAFAYTLSVYSASKEVGLTFGSAGRFDPELSKTVGMFVRTLPMRFEFPDGAKVVDSLRTARADSVETIDHSCISFGELAHAYGVNSNMSFVYQSKLISEIKIDGVPVYPEELALTDSVSHVVCMVLKYETGYRMYLHYRKSLYTPELMECFSDAVFAAAEKMLSCNSFDEISLATDKTRALVDSVNSTQVQVDPQVTVNCIFSDVAARFPDKPAVVCDDRSYTYAQLDTLSLNLAAFVAGKGIGKDDFVAVLVPRNEYMAIAAWGVIRSGAAFQPLDPTYPKERLEYMVSDSKARLLIADRSLLGLLDGFKGDVLCTDEIAGLPASPDFKAIVRPEDAITMIYTSGTTGKPKGCVLENRNVVAFFRNHTEVMGLDADSKVASYASFGFDAGVMDVVTTIMAGATMYIIPDEIRLDLLRIEEFFCSNGITLAFMTTQLGRMFAQQTKCSTLKAFIVGGEKLVPFTPSGKFKFINGYGPCETIAYVCHYEVTDNSPIQPIGRPSGNTKVYVVDSRCRLLPVGASGELCISGTQVGRGYLGLPEKTAEVFVKNPFAGGEPGYERMYRTGDVVRLLPDGNIEYIGRSDGQVKIRGFRVELTEVEEVIRRFKGIKDATVAAFDDPAGGKFIAAYVVGPKKIDIKALGRFIGSEKPSYMVPAVTMQIDAIPYTQNQKVNKRALPVPVRDVADIEIVKPENETQQRIYDMAKAILGHENFGVTTNLFEAGMTSIGMLKFNVELGKEFSRPLKISDIKSLGTIQALETLLSQGESEVKIWPLQEDYPLMQNQMGVFVESGMDEKSLEYNIPLLLKVSDQIDPEKLRDAVCRAIDAHPYMKAVLAVDAKGTVRALRHDGDAPAVDVIKVSAMPSASELVTPFKVVGSPLYKAAVYVTEDGTYLFFNIHHIIADGMSMGILLSDINAALAGETLQTEKYTAFEAALDEEALRSSDKYAEAENYCEKLLAGCNTECLPAKCPEPGAAEGSSAEFTADLPAGSSEIIAFCQKNNLSLNAFFNAVFCYVLSEFIHSDDVAYCTIYSGRNDSRLASSFAMLVKTLPVCCTVNGDMKVLDLVKSIQSQLVDSMAADAVSFAEISNKYGIKPDIFFNYQGDNFTFDSVGGCPASVVKLDLAVAKAPITFEIFLRDGVFSADITYRTDVFCSEFISSLSSAFNKAALEFTSNKALKEVSLLDLSEKMHYDEMNATSQPIRDVPAHLIFEEWAAKQPDKVAAISSGGSLTFGQMDEKANRIADSLVKMGAKDNEIVAIILDRSEFVPVAEIGIMKAGCAFLPILPTYPDERIDFCLRDASCRFVISSDDIISSRTELFAKDKPYSASSLDSLIEKGSPVKPDIAVSGSQMAYCIYTSGSTGTPKGVMIEHHNLSNYVQTSGFREGEKRSSMILCIASISFDMAITEMFFSLCQGNALTIASESETHNLDKLREIMTRDKVDMMVITPSLAWSLLSIPEFEPLFGQLKAIVLGAEALQPVLFEKMKALNPDLFIQNGYGPTECTQACSAKHVTDGENITIGSPFPNTKFYVMDDHGNLLPRFAVGELIICGECVGRGYIGLPEKNAASFFDVDGVRAYHSGDLVRVNRENEVEFGGRKDNQVKLRGFRVELDEIEAVMQEFEGVTQSKVVVRNNGTEDFLAGFFTATKKIDLEELTAFLKTKLTYYMVPAAMMQLERMPMTAGGKLDKKALPQIKPAKKEHTRRAPKKSLEEHILEMFCSVLGQQECFIDDNFFEIGGTSLSASKVVMMLKSEGYKVEYQDIFDHQTAEGLAEYLESLKKPVAGSLKEVASSSEGIPAEEKYVVEALKYNNMEHAAEVERKPLGDVLLTGATGFLGIHVLKELIDNEKGRIYCLMRKGRYSDLTSRLKTMMFYYFEDRFDEAFANRLTLIEGDITDGGLGDLLKDVSFDTLINCAACVKHYANDDSIEFINVHGVENLIAVCKAKKAKMIQISTTSVPGAHNDKTYKLHLKMTEDHLFVIDDMNNQYGRSKYKAELLMLKAISEGMRGKIVRVGNLMGRSNDGEFQINMRSNAFLNALRGFTVIGKCPISHSTDPMGFSPIDCTAKAVVTLAGTNDCFTAFNADSRWAFDEMKVIEAVNRCGIPVVPVPDEEYYNDFYTMMGDASKNEKISALLTNDRPDIHILETDNRFTTNILYRLGFSWPFIDNEYLDHVIKALKTMEFFDM